MTIEEGKKTQIKLAEKMRKTKKSMCAIKDHRNKRSISCLEKAFLFSRYYNL